MTWLWLAVAVWVASSLLCLAVGRAVGRARERREAVVDLRTWQRWEAEMRQNRWGADA